MAVDHLEPAEQRVIVDRVSDDYARIIAAQDVAAGAVLQGFGAQEVLAQPSYLSLQIAADQHILLSPDYLQYTNHSCDPNVFFDTQKMEIIALRPIAAGDEISFFYPSTEWTMDRPFPCHCGAASCLGTMDGAAGLSDAVLALYRLNPHITAALAQRARTSDQPTG